MPRRCRPNRPRSTRSTSCATQRARWNSRRSPTCSSAPRWATTRHSMACRRAPQREMRRGGEKLTPAHSIRSQALPTACGAEPGPHANPNAAHPYLTASHRVRVACVHRPGSTSRSRYRSLGYSTPRGAKPLGGTLAEVKAAVNKGKGSPDGGSAGEEHRWGAALRRLTEDDGTLRALRLSYVQPGQPPLPVQRLAAAAPAQAVLRAQLVAALQQSLSPLETVELCGVGLGDEAVPQLQRLLRRAHALRTLDLRHNRLSRAAVRTLQRTAAEVRVQHAAGGGAPAGGAALRLKATPMLPPSSEHDDVDEGAMLPSWGRLPIAARLALALAVVLVPVTVYLDATAPLPTGPWCDNGCAAPGAIDNGVCEDGGPGSAPEVSCAYGSDCYDCGIRLDPIRRGSRPPARPALVVNVVAVAPANFSANEGAEVA
eukprot:5441664-Prymnesium_polylepis.1